MVEDEDLTPDTVNLASLEDIKHLLAMAESLGDLAVIDLDNKPQTWHEAIKLPYAKEWEAEY